MEHRPSADYECVLFIRSLPLDLNVFSMKTEISAGQDVAK